MTKKDLVEIIRQNMPDGLTPIEMARYIYIELGKHRRFDLKYYYGNSKTREKIRRSALRAKTNVREFYGEKSLVCISLSYLYSSLLKEFGIDSRVITDDVGNSCHMAVVMNTTDENGKVQNIKADLQKDLPYIQAGMQTTQFGNSETQRHFYNHMSDEELRRIDRKIGYIVDSYRGENWEEILHEIENMSATDSLRYVLQDQRVIDDDSFQGHAERREYYKIVFNQLLKKYLERKIYVFTCHRERKANMPDEQTGREYSICAYSYEGGECTPYIFSIKEKRFIPITMDNLIELHNNGLEFGISRKRNGVGLLLKIMKEYELGKTSSEQTGENER